MLRDGLKITGAVEITLFDKNGDVKDTRSIKNLVKHKHRQERGDGHNEVKNLLVVHG